MEGFGTGGEFVVDRCEEGWSDMDISETVGRRAGLHMDILDSRILVIGWLLLMEKRWDS